MAYEKAPILTVEAKIRGRPSMSAGAYSKRRNAIAEVARGLFRAEGYQGVSMRRVAAEAGCTTMTLYRYFASKADLLRALWGDVFAEVSDHLAPARPGLEIKSEPLEALAQAYVAFWIANPDKYRLVFMTEGVSQDEVGAFIGDESVQALFTMFGQAVAIAMGPNSEASLRKAYADLLICTLNGIAHSTITMSAYAWTNAPALVTLALKSLRSDAESHHSENA